MAKSWVTVLRLYQYFFSKIKKSEEKNFEDMISMYVEFDDMTLGMQL